MAEVTVRSWADVTANRRPSSTPLQGIDQRVRTGAIACLRLIDGPEGCTGVHCAKEENRCKDQECLGRLQEKLSALQAENETAAIDIDEYIADIDGLLHEIEVHCRTDSLYYPAMDESRLALESALAIKIEPATCECVACQLSYQQKGAKLLKQKTKAAESRYTALSEYRRAQDKAALERTNAGYMKGGKYFTPVGGAKAKGVKALRPTLQLQNSYDVVSLSTNSMEERPLAGPARKICRKRKT